MDDIPAGVVNDASLLEETAAPETIGANGVAETYPQGHENHPCREVHTAEVAASSDDDSDGRKDKLEVYHCRLGKSSCNWYAGKRRLLELMVHCDGILWNSDKRKHIFPETGFIRIQDPDD